MEHKNEYHVDNEGEIMYGTNIWTDEELESSIMFKVPKENRKDVNNSSAKIAPSMSLDLDNNEIRLMT